MVAPQEICSLRQVAQHRGSPVSRHGCLVTSCTTKNDAIGGARLLGGGKAGWCLGMAA